MKTCKWFSFLIWHHLEVRINNLHPPGEPNLPSPIYQINNFEWRWRHANVFFCLYSNMLVELGWNDHNRLIHWFFLLLLIHGAQGLKKFNLMRYVTRNIFGLSDDILLQGGLPTFMSFIYDDVRYSADVYTLCKIVVILYCNTGSSTSRWHISNIDKMKNIQCIPILMVTLDSLKKYVFF